VANLRLTRNPPSARFEPVAVRPNVVDSEAPPMMKLLYKPFAILAAVVASLAAGAIFKRLWTLIAKETEMPRALEQHRGWAEVVAAGLLRGAVFGGVKAVVHRTFADQYFRRTGVWPGKTAKPEA
jgi:hypothetical protein